MTPYCDSAAALSKKSNAKRESLWQEAQATGLAGRLQGERKADGRSKMGPGLENAPRRPRKRELRCMAGGDISIL